MANKVYKTGKGVELLRKEQRSCNNCYFHYKEHPKIKIDFDLVCLREHLKGMKLPKCAPNIKSYIFIKKSK